VVGLDVSVQAARQSLERAKQQIDAGTTVDSKAFNFYLDLADSILDRLSGGKLDSVKGASSTKKGSDGDGTGGHSRGDSHGQDVDRLGDSSGVLAGQRWRVHRRAA